MQYRVYSSATRHRAVPSPPEQAARTLRARTSGARAGAARPCGSPAALRSIGCSRQQRATLLEPAELGWPLEGTSRVVVAPYSRAPT
eukprot:scaffold16511_cov81-Phaeocystis_antarctica.AAC.2